MDDDQILSRLRDAKVERKLHLDDLCERLKNSKGTFKPDPPALSRKLRGKTAITLTECCDLARALGMSLELVPRRRAA